MTSRLGGPRRRVAVTMVAVVALAVAVAATISWGNATAGTDELTGRSVTDEQMTSIVSAAGSCPMLTPARLAGQLMAESGLNNDATTTASGGQGIAGLDNDDWTRWNPWPKADRQDSAANMVALAHEMCDFGGQLRLAKMPGDQWRLALAAFKTGLDAVKKASRVPAEADDYVNKSTAYAAYYAKLKQFGGNSETIQPMDTPADAKPLPAQYVQAVVTAGKVCKQVSPAAVAGVVMTSSGFNVNHMGENGAIGITQILPELWTRYAPAGASAWDPDVAIPTVGSALCGLITELSSLPGDPYLLALAGYKVGPTTVRRQGGQLDATARTFIERVSSYTSYYALDARLAASDPAQPPSPQPTNPVTTRTKPNGAQGGTQAPNKPPAPNPTQPAQPLPGKSLVQRQSGMCLDGGVATDGTLLTIRPCSSGVLSQRWDIRGDGTIRSMLTGLCMDVAMANSADGTRVQTHDCTGNPAEQWRLENDEVITNIADKCLESDDVTKSGSAVWIWFCVKNGKQIWSARS